MLEVGGIVIEDLVFNGWDLPEAIDVYYYEDPETKNKVSSGFSVIYPKSKEDLMTPEFMEKLGEFKLRSMTLLDKNDVLGTLETIYYGLSSSGVEKDDQFINFGFVSDSSNTFIKISILDGNENDKNKV